MHTLTSSARKFIVIAGYIANHFNNNLKQTRISYTYIFFSYCHLYSFLVSIRDWENMFSASSISIFHIYTPSHLFPGMLDDSEIEKDQTALDNYQKANDDKVAFRNLYFNGLVPHLSHWCNLPSHRILARPQYTSSGMDISIPKHQDINQIHDKESSY